MKMKTMMMMMAEIVARGPDDDWLEMDPRYLHPPITGTLIEGCVSVV